MRGRTQRLLPAVLTCALSALLAQAAEASTATVFTPPYPQPSITLQNPQACTNDTAGDTCSNSATADSNGNLSTSTAAHVQPVASATEVPFAGVEYPLSVELKHRVTSLSIVAAVHVASAGSSWRQLEAVLPTHGSYALNDLELVAQATCGPVFAYIQGSTLITEVTKPNTSQSVQNTEVSQRVTLANLASCGPGTTVRIDVSLTSFVNGKDYGDYASSLTATLSSVTVT